MKNLFFILALLGICCCNTKNSATIEKVSNDTVKTYKTPPPTKSESHDSIAVAKLSDSKTSDLPEGLTQYDSMRYYFDDSLFPSLELEFDTILKTDFIKYREKVMPSCKLDPGGFISGKGISITGDCDEICEDFFVDKSGRMIQVPSDYDAGVMGIDVSPSCDKFIVYSSYDGPDYHKYYSYRAEIFGFAITNEEGLKAIKPLFKYYTKDWSIEEVIWVTNNSIAVKMYEEARWGDGEHLQHKYIKAMLNQK